MSSDEQVRAAYEAEPWTPRRRFDPPPPVDWADEASVCSWIEHVRWSAFFNGARGDEISKAEATALVAALGAKQ